MLLFTVPYKAIPPWKGHKSNFQKKIYRSQEIHNIPPKKITKTYFCLKIFQIYKECHLARKCVYFV